jgi:hypothetical protein
MGFLRVGRNLAGSGRRGLRGWWRLTARWLIEEWFKALKTGCADDDRQLESLDTLRKAFTLLAPVVTRLLALRWLAHSAPDQPATGVVSPPELGFLRVLQGMRKRKPPPAPTVYDVMLGSRSWAGS